MEQIVSPLKLEQQAERPRSAKADADTIGFLRSITLYEDDDVMVLNKPAGLAVQGGSGTTRHVDQMLEALTGKDGQKPRRFYPAREHTKKTFGDVLGAARDKARPPKEKKELHPALRRKQMRGMARLPALRAST